MIFPNQPLAPYTSWQVGGPADFLLIPEDFSEIKNFLAPSSSHDISCGITWLGAGTNVLIRDGGIRGKVIILKKNALTQLKLLPIGAAFMKPDIKAGYIYAEAGVLLSKLVQFAVKAGLSGLENLAGIPGTVGGALAMNAGAYGVEIWDGVESVSIIDRSGECQTRKPRDYIINYRSINIPNQEFFISAIFKLTPDSPLALKKVVAEKLAKRKQSQPLEFPNAGSVFKNPPNDYAARLIESAGLKNYRIGGATVSGKHANFIINTQKASATDIEQLIWHVQEVVKAKHGVVLIPEVRILGCKR